MSRALRIVAMGGGNGLSTVLRGLAQRWRAGATLNITAIVATADNGGSSGRLRRERGGLPPGDLRNCLLALSPEDQSLARVFAHRYEGDGDLAGHAVGNLMLSALAEQEGCFQLGVDRAASLLQACGRVMPVSLCNVQLRGVTRQGTEIVGEAEIGEAPCAMERVWLEPANPVAGSGVIQALLDADVIVLGPGSLYTSLLPVLLVPGVTDAMRRTGGRRVAIANLMTQPGETLGMGLGEHLAAIDSHVGPGLIQDVLFHEGHLDLRRLAAYREQFAEPVLPEEPEGRPERMIGADLVTAEGKIRHDPEKLCRALLADSQNSHQSFEASADSATHSVSELQERR